MSRHLDRNILNDLATQARLTVTGVTTAEPFHDAEEYVVDHIERGHLAGFDWYTTERARQSADPRTLHEGVRSIVSVAVPFWSGRPVPPDDQLRGRIARYAWGRDYHKTLRGRMKALHARLEEVTGRDIEARFLVDTARIVDRAVAARSGLGWQGKNTMILVPGHGSWVMLGELVLDIELEPDPPLRPRCGRCTACLDACPTGALIDAYTLDTPKCISFLTIELRGAIPHELRPQMGDWVFGCDVCQEVCPYTGAAKPVDEAAFRPARIENAFPPLRWLLRMTEEEFRAVYTGTAVMRAKRRGLARNAAVALGNVGTQEDLALLEEVVARHDEPLVRGHAAWAMARIDAPASAPALLRRLTAEEDPYVRDEIAAALAGSAQDYP